MRTQKRAITSKASNGAEESGSTTQEIWKPFLGLSENELVKPL